MLFRFRTSNFRSIREDVELSLVASNLSDLPGAVLPTPFADLGALPVAAIYGSNASGKTNLLRALQFMMEAVDLSQRRWEPEGIRRDVFRLDEEAASSPSLFEADFSLGQVRYTYGFEIDSRRVLREWLHAYPTPRRQKWFERYGDDFTFGKSLSGENSVIQSLTRPNSLFLSAAAQNNHEQLLPVHRFFSADFFFVMGDRAGLIQGTAEIAQRDEYRRTFGTLLQAADLGIERVDICDRKYHRVLRILIEKGSIDPLDAPVEPYPKQVEFLHSGSHTAPTFIPIEEESEGTVAYFGLLGPVLDALAKGGLLVIDEITASLHPLLAAGIVRMFNSSERNPKGAQLIFNTHDVTLLDSSILRRDQVWFTEKGETGATHLYPLTDFKPRRGENVKTGYLQGRYGGVPFVEPPERDDEADGAARAK